jgi:alpha-L-rhamnosidase
MIDARCVRTPSQLPRAFDVAPIVDDRIGWARIAHQTARGRIEVAWRRSGGGWELDVEVPDTATATVRLPGLAETTFRPGRHALRQPAVAP